MIPEPSTFILLTLGFLGIRGRKIMKLIKKNVGERNVSLRILFFFVLSIILSAAVSQAQASWEIYNDTDITSGTYGLIDIYDSPPDNTTVNFYGDLADYIGTHDSSILNFFSGKAELQAMDTSAMNISGGTLSFAEARYESKINVSGLANIGSLRAEDFSEIIVTGGSISAMGAKNSGIINLYGGELIEGIHATDSGQINVYGHDLVKTTSGGYYGYGQLYGYLTDETYICVDIFDLETHDHINLIPEPATFVLFGIGSLVLLRKRNPKINR
jgi:hypothetical protein